MNRTTLQIPLTPLAGDRFQPTGFPDLGAAQFQRPGAKAGEWVAALHVESPQSMANRLEISTWDSGANQQVAALDGIPFVDVRDPNGEFLTSSRLEAHRVASAYIMEGTVNSVGRTGFDWLPGKLGLAKGKAIDHHKLAAAVFDLDPLSLIHGVFFARKGGGWAWQPKIARAVTSFIDADDVRAAFSGGVKTDSVDPTGGATDTGYGMVPHQRTEFTARTITAYVTIDHSQLRSYGLGEARTELLESIIDFELSALFHGDGLRLRTACDLRPLTADELDARDLTSGINLISTPEAAIARVRSAIDACQGQLGDVTVVAWSGRSAKAAKSAD